VTLAESGALQVRQLQVVEKKRQKFLARQHERERIAALAFARLVAVALAGAGVFRPWQLVTGHEFPVAGDHEPAVAGLLVVRQMRLGQPAARDCDAAAAADVGDRALGELLVGRPLDLALETADEALAVDGAASLRVDAAVDDAHEAGADAIAH